MVVGLGVDIVEVARIRKALENQPKMVERVFTDEEAGYCAARKNQFQHFAGRFAAKEAALKALGTGWAEGIRWRDVEVTSDPSGQPRIRFHGRANEVFESISASRALLTITHAVAVVILETDG
jgi:holo-[acyl-carrier protein] synthase